MEILLRGGDRSGTRRVVVVQLGPHCRTIRLDSYGETDLRFVSLPYLVFVITHDVQFSFCGLRVFFREDTLCGEDDPLSLTCFPNTSENGLVCLGGACPSGGCEERLVRSAIDVFFTTTFVGEGPHIWTHGDFSTSRGQWMPDRELFRQWMPSREFFHLWAAATALDRGCGLKVAWRRGTEAWLERKGLADVLTLRRLTRYYGVTLGTNV